MKADRCSCFPALLLHHIHIVTTELDVKGRAGLWDTIIVHLGKNP